MVTKKRNAAAGVMALAFIFLECDAVLAREAPGERQLQR